MPRYAIVDGGAVDNVVLWDGESPCLAIPESAIQLPDDSPVGPGWMYANGQFTAPPQPEPPALGEPIP